MGLWVRLLQQLGLHRSPELEPRYQIRFSVLHRTPLFEGEGGVSFLQGTLLANSKA